MSLYYNSQNKEKNISYILSDIYEKHGYKKYKMGSFEEYSMYNSYRDFLVSKNIITFTGLDGKLMALRPDVTLSIVKNTKATNDNTEKLFYNEKVYRENSNTKEYKEISQMGVEVIGNIDKIAIIETTMLILETLNTIDKNFVLDISDMGFVSGLINSFDVNSDIKGQIYTLLKNKNVHDFIKLAKQYGISDDDVNRFKELSNIDGNFIDAITRAEKIVKNDEMKFAVDELKSLYNAISFSSLSKKINLNFSIANNTDYYNGIIYNGYVSGVPKVVLSGGRYDKLLEKFNKNVGAIGFAVYLGELERYFITTNNFSSDILLIYKETDDFSLVYKFADELIKQGNSVRLADKIPENFCYKKVYKVLDGNLLEVKND